MKTLLEPMENGINLRLNIILGSAPLRLSDFAGSIAEIHDGYSTHISNFAIELARIRVESY